MSISAVAEQIEEEYLLGPEDRYECVKAIEAALNAERERCAKIAEDDDCGLKCHGRIASLIREANSPLSMGATVSESLER